MATKPPSTRPAAASSSGGSGGEKEALTVPFSDPYWYGDILRSPYYTESHRAFRDRVRAFVDREVAPFASEWDEKGDFPSELVQKAYAAGIYGAIWPAELGGTPPENFDYFHALVLLDELARAGAGGLMWAAFVIVQIALPPVLEHGSSAMRARVGRECITGQKVIALAITEPYVGSDVANARATARRDGDHYIVNGEKKFITAGTKASYFVTAVRTGGSGMSGLSLLLIERDTPGVSVRRMKTQGWWTSGTAYLVFEDVRVPVKNLIGREGEGFKYIVTNFNHERFMFSAMANRFARVCLEEAIKYGRKRQTFGKRLLDHQVLRHKCAEMARCIEATHAWLELVAYQVKCGVESRHLAGPMALLKVQATRTMEYCAREASQIFGGASYIRGGVGERVERLYREVRSNAIAGGSEEVLLDFAARQAKL